MKEFVENLIKHLVDKPGEVQVNEITGQRTVVFEVRVGDGDMGKVIGRRGQNARSIRILLGAAAAKQGKRTVLEILNLNKMEQKNSQNKNPEREVTARKRGSEFQSNDEKRWQDNGRNNL